ncbi:MAG: hypothetical protein U0354_05315 [Candidatus Sericytochromatia bacterium]
MFGISEITLTTLYIIIGNIALLSFLLEIFKLANISNTNRFIILIISLLWLLFLNINLSNNNLFSSNISPIKFSFILFGFVGIVCILFSFKMDIRNKLLNLSYEILLLPQGLRVFFGAGFLIEGVLGQLPRDFSIADGLFHILSAFFALKAGLLYSRNKNNISEIWFANIFGLIDLIIVALGIPFALIPKIGSNHNMMYAAFFAAPIFVAFHFISIWKLILDNKQYNLNNNSLKLNNIL